MKSVPDSLLLFSRLPFDPAVLRYYPSLDRVEQYVRAHISERVSLDTASRIAHLERKYFSAFFRSKVGIRFRDWIAVLRVKHAMDAMRARWDTVPRIAFNAGFKDVRSFERTFKKLTGTTPKEFRALVAPGSRLPSQQSRHLPRR